jgi:hypothetical protein
VVFTLDPKVHLETENNNLVGCDKLALGERRHTNLRLVCPRSLHSLVTPYGQESGVHFTNFQPDSLTSSPVWPLWAS